MGGHLKAKMMYYHIYLCLGNKYNHYCVITQTLQNGQTLGQFFELLYVIVPTVHSHLSCDSSELASFPSLSVSL